MCFCAVVDDNDEDADYDNVQGRLATAANTNNVRSVADADAASAVDSRQPELTAAETTASGMSKLPENTKVKKEKKKFSWGQKKKKKPRTAAGIQCWADVFCVMLNHFKCIVVKSV